LWVQRATPLPLVATSGIPYASKSAGKLLRKPSPGVFLSAKHHGRLINLLMINHKSAKLKLQVYFISSENQVLAFIVCALHK